MHNNKFLGSAAVSLNVLHFPNKEIAGIAQTIAQLNFTKLTIIFLKMKRFYKNRSHIPSPWTFPATATYNQDFLPRTVQHKQLLPYF